MIIVSVLSVYHVRVEIQLQLQRGGFLLTVL